MESLMLSPHILGWRFFNYDKFITPRIFMYKCYLCYNLPQPLPFAFGTLNALEELVHESMSSSFEVDSKAEDDADKVPVDPYPFPLTFTFPLLLDTR